MKYDELAHYGVKGMRWRFKKGTTIKPSSGIRSRKLDDTPRIEKEKNIVLTGKSGKKFQTSEREVDDKDEREELNEKMKSAEIADREAREEAARLAAQRLLEQARARAAKKEKPKVEPKKPLSYPKSSSIIFANTTASDYYKAANGKYRLKSKS